MSTSKPKETIEDSAKSGLRKSKKHHFARTLDTPENLAKALFRLGVKKSEE